MFLRIRVDFSTNRFIISIGSCLMNNLLKEQIRFRLNNFNNIIIMGIIKGIIIHTSFIIIGS